MPRESAVARALLGVEAEWTIDTHIAAHIADGIWVANWQRSAGTRSQYPKPIPRPGEEKKRDHGIVLGTVTTIADIDEMRKSTRRG